MLNERILSYKLCYVLTDTTLACKVPATHQRTQMHAAGTGQAPGDLASLLHKQQDGRAIAVMAGNLGQGVQGVEQVSSSNHGITHQAGADQVDGQVSSQATASGRDHAHQLGI